MDFDVVIVGGGWSGLVTCKLMLEAGLSAVVLEKREGIGGVWRYSDDLSTVTVMKNTITTSSSTVTEISDFPMPEEYGDFPHHSNILKYLEDYCKKFSLFDHIRFNTEVKQVKKSQDQWVVTTKNGKEYRSKFLCICSGTHQVPNEELSQTLFKNFKGTVKHSILYKYLLPEHRGKKILIYGGGETASDIANECSFVAEKVYFSIPHGQWFQRRKG